MSDGTKSVWDKADIILKPVGGLLTAVSVALVGFFGTQYLENSQSAETSVRLYAQMMSSREEADSALRKEMFDSIIRTFLAGESEGHGQSILALELLAYNFHDSLDLRPLFQHVERQIFQSEVGDREELLKRLQRVAQEVTARQIAATSDVGVILSGNYRFKGGKAKIISDDLSRPVVQKSARRNIQKETASATAKDTVTPSTGNAASRTERASSASSTQPPRKFLVEVIDFDEESKTVDVRLQVWRSKKRELDITKKVGFFDFPLINNIRLANGQRCAVVLKDWNRSRARINLVYFPGSRASLKDKPYYDEVIQDLLRTRKLLAEGR